jgi:ArsR family transcriptional regulator, arsenate/arsenite/antimonite-responsive transcriptional repressor / arsenate reductase (thioredoxin)
MMAYSAYPATSTPEVADFFRTLADSTRLAIIRMLALSDRKAGELGSALHLPSNAVSYHLKQLRSLGLLHDHRSGADGRDVYYRLDLDHLTHLYADAGDTLHPGLGASLPQPSGTTAAQAASPTPLRVLFLCTHNSARSQLAEALMRQMVGEHVEVYSAGSMPTEVHPDTITVLRELGIDPSALYAKSLDRFIGERFDYIITVCDRVRDACPAFVGDPNQIHWSFPDPVVVEDPERRLKAFRQVAAELRTRIGYLLLLPHPATGERLPPRR